MIIINIFLFYGRLILNIDKYIYIYIYLMINYHLTIRIIFFKFLIIKKYLSFSI